MAISIGIHEFKEIWLYDTEGSNGSNQMDQFQSNVF